MNVPGAMDYGASPRPYSPNPEMAQAIDENSVFSSVKNQVEHQRTVQAMKYFYAYPLTGDVVGQQTSVFTLTIEQGTDFACYGLVGSMYSYDAGNASSFPVPNSAGSTAWAGRGLSARVVDTRSGRELTGGFVALELLLTPGYGLNFQSEHGFTFRYFFYRNSKIRFDIRNRDNANRTHHFDIALVGYKILTPQ